MPELPQQSSVDVCSATHVQYANVSHASRLVAVVRLKIAGYRHARNWETANAPKPAQDTPAESGGPEVSRDEFMTEHLVTAFRR